MPITHTDYSVNPRPVKGENQKERERERGKANISTQVFTNVGKGKHVRQDSSSAVIRSRLDLSKNGMHANTHTVE